MSIEYSGGPRDPASSGPKGRILSAALLLFGFGLCALLADESSGASSLVQDAVPSALEGRGCSTVIFVRHAEKDPSGDPKDPGLSEAGRKRVAALHRILAHAEVSRLLSSEFRRAQETLAPFVESTGHKLEIIPAGDPGRMITALTSAPAGSVYLVAGHSNTIPALIEKLGGHVVDLVSTPQGPQMRESEYDRMFVLTLGPPKKSGEPASRMALGTLELRYGD